MNPEHDRREDSQLEQLIRDALPPEPLTRLDAARRERIAGRLGLGRTRLGFPSLLVASAAAALLVLAAIGSAWWLFGGAQDRVGQIPDTPPPTVSPGSAPPSPSPTPPTTPSLAFGSLPGWYRSDLGAAGPQVDVEFVLGDQAELPPQQEETLVRRERLRHTGSRLELPSLQSSEPGRQANERRATRAEPASFRDVWVRQVPYRGILLAVFLSGCGAGPTTLDLASPPQRESPKCWLKRPE